MVTKKKRKKPRAKIHCKGQLAGRRRLKKGTCARSRCAGQMMGSTKGGKPKRRKKSVCLKAKPKRTRRAASKRKATARKRAVAKRGVVVRGRRVYGAAAKAVQKKRARKGPAKRTKRRNPTGSAYAKRSRIAHGQHGSASIGGMTAAQVRVAHDEAQVIRDLKGLEHDIDKLQRDLRAAKPARRRRKR